MHTLWKMILLAWQDKWINNEYMMFPKSLWISLWTECNTHEEYPTNPHKSDWIIQWRAIAANMTHSTFLSMALCLPRLSVSEHVPLLPYSPHSACFLYVFPISSFILFQCPFFPFYIPLFLYPFFAFIYSLDFHSFFPP